MGWIEAGPYILRPEAIEFVQRSTDGGIVLVLASGERLPLLAAEAGPALAALHMKDQNDLDQNVLLVDQVSDGAPPAGVRG